MSVAVVIPWRGGCEHRDRALQWVEPRIRATGWRVIVAGAPPGDWIKAAAVNPVIARLPVAYSTVVVMDADVWCQGLQAAVSAVQAGARWAVPHQTVYRLTPESTSRLIAGEPPEGLPTSERPHRATRGGGIVVLNRDLANEVPMDPRFRGWGQEDSAYGLALQTLAGEAWASDVPLYHLWHPPQARNTRKVGSIAGQQLYRRYITARIQGPEVMRALIKEAQP